MGWSIGAAATWAGGAAVWFGPGAVRRVLRLSRLLVSQIAATAVTLAALAAARIWDVSEDLLDVWSTCWFLADVVMFFAITAYVLVLERRRGRALTASRMAVGSE